MPHIFISYRRQDSITFTGRIYDRLLAAFGESSLFKDVDNIPVGVDFRKVIQREVGRCDVLLAIIGTQYAKLTLPDGRIRLFDPSDFVRLEIEAGLNQARILVVPVLISGASMPAPNDLPESLHPLLYRNAAQVGDDPNFHRDMSRLIDSLKGYFEQLEGLRTQLKQLEQQPAEPSWQWLAGRAEALRADAEQIASLDAILSEWVEKMAAQRAQAADQAVSEAESVLGTYPLNASYATDRLRRAESIAPPDATRSAKIAQVRMQLAEARAHSAPTPRPPSQVTLPPLPSEGIPGASKPQRLSDTPFPPLRDDPVPPKSTYSARRSSGGRVVSRVLLLVIGAAVIFGAYTVLRQPDLSYSYVEPTATRTLRPTTRPTTRPMEPANQSRAPVITRVIAQGECTGFDWIVSWRDSDGDAVRLEIVNEDGSVRDWIAISGSYDSTHWNRTCGTGGCTDWIEVVDSLGNRSDRYTATKMCQ